MEATKQRTQEGTAQPKPQFEYGKLENLNYESRNIISPTPEEILYALREAPIPESGFIKVHFRAGTGSIIPGSSARLVVVERRRATAISIDKVDIPRPEKATRKTLQTILAGGRIEQLAFEFPGFDGKHAQYFDLSRPLKAFRRVLPDLVTQGYILQDFKMSWHPIEVQVYRTTLFGSVIGGIILDLHQNEEAGCQVLSLKVEEEKKDKAEVPRLNEIIDEILRKRTDAQETRS